MKHLTITYNGVTLWDAPVGSMEWHDSENGIKVEGRVKAASKVGAGGGGLLDMLTNISKAKTAQVVEQKRDEYAEETAELVEDSA